MSRPLGRQCWIPCIPACPAVLFLANFNVYFDYKTFTFFGLPSQSSSSINIIVCRKFGLLRFRSSLLTESIFLSFPTGTKIFQFPAYSFHFWILSLLLSGFPHSDICGSSSTYLYPQRFAVSRVLHRLLVPRHPLCALFSLTLQFYFLCLYRCIYFSKIFYHF